MDMVGKFLGQIKPVYEDDIVDRLHYYYTVMALLVASVTLAAKQYVGHPVQCFVPAQFKGSWEAYTEDFCLIENTYFVPMEQRLPDDPADRRKQELSYYQWVPLVLALQALLFHLPHIIWKMLNFQSGLNVGEIMRMARETKIAGPDREKDIKIVAAHIEDACDASKQLGKNVNPFVMIANCGSPKSIYVTLLYLFIKLLYMANIIGQFFLLNRFLDVPYKFWGAEVFADLLRGRVWQDSGTFPRVTMCDFKVREMGNIHPWSVQCVLMVNMFNEKVYLFIWWWFLILAIFTGVNFLWWAFTAIVPAMRVDFVKKYLDADPTLTASGQLDKQRIETFVRSKLRSDGVLVLRLMSNNVGDMTTTLLLRQLWQDYLEEGTPNGFNRPYPGGNSEHKPLLPIHAEKSPISEKDIVA